MSREFSITVDIAAPPDRVWSVMSDIERWNEWTESVTSVTRLDTGPLQVGSRAEIVQPKLPPTQFTVTALEVGKGFTWETKSGGVTAVANHWIEAAAQGSRVTLSVSFEGALGVLAALMVKSLTNRYLAMEAAGLKKRCESV